MNGKKKLYITHKKKHWRTQGGVEWGGMQDCRDPKAKIKNTNFVDTAISVLYMLYISLNQPLK
jgi:hypothetical protein